jgi:6-phosphogluconolactonase (cycloisomerase 2 family)
MAGAFVLATVLAPLACGSSPGSHDGGVEDASVEDGTDARTTAPDGTVSDAPSADGGRDDGETDAPDAARPPEIVFVATYLGGLSSFVVDDATGRLDAAPGSPYDRGAQLYALAVHPSGRFVYATDLRGTINSYGVTAGVGMLAPLPGSPLAIGSAAISVAIDPSGRYLYVGDQESLHVFAVDQSTGALAALPNSPFDTGGRPCTIVFHPSGGFVFASFVSIAPAGNGGIRAFAIDAASGAPTEVAGSPFATTGNVRGGGMVLDPDGKFLYIGSSNVLGFSIDRDTGGLSALAGFPVPGGNSDSTAIDLAVEPRGRYLYATSNLGTVHGYGIDAASGMLSAVPGSPFDGHTLPYSVAVDRAGRFVYVGNDDVNELSVFSLDATTGALAPIASSPFTVNGIQPEIAVTGG